jgi:hypothetical protein
MTSTVQDRLSEELAENIALLSILSRAPTPSQGNPRPSTEKDTGRLLSFRQEQRLAEVLAFISGISDDPTRVVALCVEELAIGKGIRVVIAINKTGPESGSDILQRIQNGLKNLFSHLAQVNDGVSLETAAAKSSTYTV